MSAAETGARGVDATVWWERSWMGSSSVLVGCWVVGVTALVLEEGQRLFHDRTDMVELIDLDLG